MHCIVCVCVCIPTYIHTYIYIYIYIYVTGESNLILWSELILNKCILQGSVQYLNLRGRYGKAVCPMPKGSEFKYMKKVAILLGATISTLPQSCRQNTHTHTEVAVVHIIILIIIIIINNTFKQHLQNKKNKNTHIETHKHTCRWGHTHNDNKCLLRSILHQRDPA